MNWPVVGLLLLMMVGFFKLTTVIVNRILAIPQPKWLIGVTELAQVSLFPCYGLALWAAFRNVPPTTVLLDLGWNNLSVLGRILECLGVAGLALLVRSIIGYQLYRSPSNLVAEDTRLWDLRQDHELQPWQSVLVGRGPMRRLALLPGNQQYSVEINTKTFEFDRLPMEWDGLSIVHFADLHFRGAVERTYFQRVCKQAAEWRPDLYVFTGDLLDEPSLLDWLPETLGRLSAPLGQYFILGNHDWYLGADRIRQQFTKSGWTDLAGRIQSLISPATDRRILLAGDETPWMGEHPVIPEGHSAPFRILLSHTPDNIDWARSQQFDLMLAGHTHGGQIRLPLIGPVYSPSRYGCQFASGSFWLAPTLMHVSRGLSGREPIRYQCPPELTRIILRRAKS